MLLDKGADINAKNKCGRTPFYSAIEYTEIKITELLLMYNADVKDRDNNDASPLLVATKIGCLEIIKHLLNYGANINIRGVNNITPLYVASEEGYEDVVALFLNRGADINACTKDNLTPLHIATYKGFKSIVKMLLQHGANVDDQDKYGQTILNFAVEKGCITIIQEILKYRPDISNESNRISLESAVYGHGEKYKRIVDALLEYGFTINTEVANISKLLHVAITRGHLSIVENLLKYGIDVNLLHNSKSTHGFTLLHTAVDNQQEEVAKLLISYGADINAQDNIRKTPIFYATENADVKITNLLLTNRAYVKEYPELLRNAVKNDHIEIVKALLQYDTDINASDEYGRTALHFTVLTETDDFFRHVSVEDYDINIKAEIANLLLSKGANVDDVTEDGVTVLHVAILKGYTEIVEILLEYNADVNYKIRNNITPLHLAAKKGFQKIIEILLKFGADVNSTDVYGRTALYIASEKNHIDVIMTLLEYDSEFDFIDLNNKVLLPPGWSVLNLTELYSESDDESDDDSDEYEYDGSEEYEYDDSADEDPNFYTRLSEEVAEVFKHHVIKLKTANFYVNKVILQLMKSYDMSEFEFKCKKEIAKMECEKINVKISFFDLLVKEIKLLSVYMKNENIVQVLQSESYKTKFPIYAGIIKSNFIKTMYRKTLYKKGNEIFHCLFNNTPKLPYDCTEKIVSYFNEEDIKSLLKAYLSSNCN